MSPVGRIGAALLAPQERVDAREALALRRQHGQQVALGPAEQRDLADVAGEQPPLAGEGTDRRADDRERAARARAHARAVYPSRGSREAAILPRCACWGSTWAIAGSGSRSRTRPAILASPLPTIERVGPRKDLKAVAALARQHGARAIVVGLPRRLDGGIGPQAEKVQEFAEALRPVAQVPVSYWDERLTTARPSAR